DSDDFPRGDVLLLPVMVPGGPQAEFTEQRLRAREAVLNGLAASGFVTYDPEHIGFCELRGWHTTDLTAADSNPFERLHEISDEAPQIPIPYEWCLPTILKLGTTGRSTMAASQPANASPTTVKLPSTTSASGPQPMSSTKPAAPAPQKEPSNRVAAVLVLWLRDEDFDDVPL